MQVVKQPTLVVVHTEIIQSQWIDDATSLMGLPQELVGRIGGKKAKGKWDIEGKDLVVAMAQSISKDRNRSLQLAYKFGLAIYDEVHHYQGNTFKHALPICNGMRVGLSATVEMDGREHVFMNHLGRVVYHNEETDLDPTITLVDVNAALSDAAQRRIHAYDMDIDSLRARTMNEVAVSEINQPIIHHILENRKKKRRQLVLSDRIDQLLFLHTQIPDSGILIGSTTPGERDRILNECDVILAITAIATEGLNQPALDTLHICLPWSSKRRCIQGMGRIIRAYPDKKEPLVFAYNPVDVPILSRTFRNFVSNCNRYQYTIRRTTWENSAS